MIEMRRILITNDDGIDAEGLLKLVKAAKDFGEVWVVAPDGQRSSTSHCITLHNYIDIFPYDMGISGVRAFTCSGTPADCIRVGSIAVMDEKPDIVLSGINNGYNTATDVQYSGTAGAAFEGAFQGYPSIAFSEGVKYQEVSDKYLRDILEEYIDMEFRKNHILNVNFPDCPVSECKGILRDRALSESMIYKDDYKQIGELLGGGRRYMVDGHYQEIAEAETDLRAVLDNYISIGYVSNHL